MQSNDRIFTQIIINKFQEMVQHETLQVMEDFITENEPKIREMIRDRVRKNAIEMSVKFCKMVDFNFDKTTLVIRMEDKTT